MASYLNFAVKRCISQSARLNYAATAGGGDAHKGGYLLWKRLTFLVAFPAIALGMVNVYMAHADGHHERPEFKAYEHLRRRTKRFPWGDGNHSLFHNPHLNALPDGYEE